MLEFWRFHSVDQTKYALIEADFNILLVFLSIIVAGLAAYSTLVVLERVWEVKVKKNDICDRDNNQKTQWARIANSLADTPGRNNENSSHDQHP